MRVQPVVGLDYSVAGVTLALNAGWQFRATREAGSYASDDLLRWSFGARIPLGTPLLALLATVRGSAALVGSDSERPDEGPSLPTEALGALELRVAEGLVLSAAGGAPIVRGVGSPDVRAFFGVAWTPPAAKDKDGDGIPDAADTCPGEAEDDDDFRDADGCPDPDNDEDGILDPMDRCPDKAETKNGIDDGDGCPESDADSDGILDGPDRCPDKPEDHDGFEDDDGCPDPDNDGDGVADASDKCPKGLEDRDGFQDDDGCPDPDNDGDGIPDGSDRCPNEPESKNGVEDGDGCAEPDADLDGVPDPSDRCANRPETRNGFQDDDGCPDTTEKSVTVTEEMLVPKQPVPFAKGADAIPKTATATLDALARVLAELPYITALRIEAHTDSEGDPEANRALTLRRAEAVNAYL
ncbi:MAG: thrombospondin type 3 repeat-containing protein, partial [Deltaproteobacteria bacterium]|nr:thrombospondin type 3 repeat-containing protein [Deltaproteobacteria bacterium]